MTKNVTTASLTESYSPGRSADGLFVTLSILDYSQAVLYKYICAMYVSYTVLHLKECQVSSSASHVPTYQ